MNELALFAGAGGGILGGKLLGWQTVCAVEWEPYAASVLCARQNDKVLPPFPIWDDVQTFDGKPWRGIVDVVSGGFPCQEVSIAKDMWKREKGLDGEQSGLWTEMARVICEVQPTYAFIENSPALVVRGLDRIMSDLASMGYDARWGVLGATHVGAPHRRERCWIVAYSNKIGLQRQWPKPNTQGWEDAWRSFGLRCREELGREQHWWKTEPNVGRVANGVADRVDRLKAIGNGQVPLCAASAWRILNELATS